MKKLLSLLLTAVMLCSMLAVFAVPAIAAPKQGVGVIDITSGTQFRQTLESMDDGRTVVLNLKTDMSIDHEVLLEANNCSILIRVDDTYYSKYGDVKIYPRYLSDDDNYRFLNITGNNVKLYFDGHVICRDFIKSGRYIGYASGAAIIVNGENCLIANGIFYNCTAGPSGGAIYVDKVNAIIKQCKFMNCRTYGPGGGGGIAFNEKDGIVYKCVFIDNLSMKETDPETSSFGEDIAGYHRKWVDTRYTTVINCESNSKREYNYIWCIVDPDDAPVISEESINDIFGTDLDLGYYRPPLSKYAQDAMDANGFCDAFRPDKADSVPSEKGYFTLNGENFYGGTWSVSSESPLTITACEGLLIERMEAIVDYTEGKFENLVADKGTLSKGEKNSDAWNKDIVYLDNIYSSSVTVKTNGDKYNNKIIHFNEVIVYFVEDTPENRRTEAPESSPEYTRDGETYDVFTFDRDTYTAGSGSTKSELKGFTLTDTAVPSRGHIYGWATGIAITAPEGYTITRIEGKPVHFESYVEYLKSDAGTIVDQGKPLAKDGIVRINDINASSIVISCTSDYVEFGEFLVFYEENAVLGSVFSVGTLWIIIGVAVAAAAASVVIVVVKKKKPAMANGATAEKSEE